MDHSPNPNETYLDRGKEVLLGWLVGKAGADLSLAQLLASNGGAGVQQSILDLKAQLAALKSGFEEHQRRVDPAQSLFIEAVEALRSKIREIQEQLAQEQSSGDGRESRLDRFDSELRNLKERASQAELLGQQAQDRLAGEFNSAARVRDGLKIEVASLRAELTERQALDSVNGRFHENLVTLIHEIHRQQNLEAEVSERRDRDLAHLKTEIRQCAERMQSLESIAQQADRAGEELKTELKEVRGHIDERQTALASDELHNSLLCRIQDLEQELRQNLEFIASRDANSSQLALEMNRLAARVAQLESAVIQARSAIGEVQPLQQSVAGLNSGLAAVAAALAPIQNNFLSLGSLAETLDARTQALEARLEKERQDLQARDSALKNFEAAIQSLIARMTDAESAAQQNAALIVELGTSNEKLREESLSQTASLRAQAGETAKRLSERLENQVSTGIHNCQIELDGKLELFDRHNAEQARTSDAARAVLQTEIQRLKSEINKNLPLVQAGNEHLKRLDSQIAALLERIVEVESTAHRSEKSSSRQSETLQQNLANVRAEMAGLKTEIQENQKLMPSVRQAFESSVAARMQDLENQLKFKNGRLQNLETWFNEALPGELTALQVKLSETENALEAQNSNSRDLAESVRTQIHELEEGLRQRLDGLANRDPELDRMRLELDALLNRTSRIETNRLQDEGESGDRAVQSCVQKLEMELEAIRSQLDQPAAGDLIKHDLNGRIRDLEDQIQQQRNLLDRRDAEHGERINEQGENARQQMQRLEAQVQEKFQTIDSRTVGLSRWESNIDALIERVSRIEGAVHGFREDFASQNKGYQQTVTHLQADLVDLRNEIGDQRDLPLIKRLEDLLSVKVEAIQKEASTRRRELEARELQLQAVEPELRMLIEKSRQAESLGQRSAVFEKELTELQTHLGALHQHVEAQRADMERIDGTVSAKIHLLEDKIGNGVRTLENDGHELDRYKTEIHGLVQRIGQLENALHQADITAANNSCGLREDVANAEAQIIRIQAQLDATATDRSPIEILHGIERNLDARIQGIEDQFINAQELDLREARLKESFRSELGELGSLVRELRSETSPIDDLERSLSQSIRDLRVEVTEKFRVLESRGIEVSELKAEVLALMRGQTSPLRHPGPREPGERFAVSGKSPARGDSPPIGAPEDLRLQAGPLAHGTNGPSALGHEREMAKDPDSDHEKEQISRLQERMSAEIERVRAELKEKSGRWKVRKGVSSGH